MIPCSRAIKPSQIPIGPDTCCGVRNRSATNANTESRVGGTAFRFHAGWALTHIIPETIAGSEAYSDLWDTLRDY